MNGRVFVDTSVLVYAHDVDAGLKHSTAAELLEELWSSKTGALSVQVLQEFYVNVTRKIRSALSRKLAREVVETYAAWHVEGIGPEDVLQASRVEERHRIAFWDALIVVAANKAGASRLLSEDFSHGHRIEGVSIENPFATR